MPLPSSIISPSSFDCRGADSSCCRAAVLSLDVDEAKSANPAGVVVVAVVVVAVVSDNEEEGGFMEGGDRECCLANPGKK